MNRKERPVILRQADMVPALQNAYFELKNRAINRREFIQRTSLVFAVGVLPLLSAPAVQSSMRNAQSEYKEEPWLTIYAVQQHLLPSEKDSPGAEEINATKYLKSVLEDDFLSQEEKKFILKGPRWLNDLAVTTFKQSFIKLTNSQQNDLLKQIAKSTAGENWLATLLTYIFEAMLAAPIYGGNPGGIGWKWLQHHPGFPQPDKTSLTWQQLQKR